MTGRTPFKALRDRMSEKQRSNVEGKVMALRQSMALYEVRQARSLTQESLGEALQVGQPAIAKLEKRTDMYIRTLGRFVHAMGGELDIIARFPEGAVRISNFSDMSSDTEIADEPQQQVRA